MRERRGKRALVAAGKGPFTVADAMADYFKFIESKRKPTRTARSHDRLLIQPKLGAIEVADLFHRDAGGAADGIATGKARARTAEGKPQRFLLLDDDIDEDEIARRRQAAPNRVMATLRASLNFAWRRGKVSSDAAWRRVEVFRGVDTPRLRYLEIEEARRLVNACPPDFRRLVRGLLETGARYQQLAKTVASDFNADGGTLRLATKKGRRHHQDFSRRAVGGGGGPIPANSPPALAGAT